MARTKRQSSLAFRRSGAHTVYFQARSSINIEKNSSTLARGSRPRVLYTGAAPGSIENAKRIRDDNSSRRWGRRKADFGKSIGFVYVECRSNSTRRFVPQARRTCFQPPRVDVPRAWARTQFANVVRQRA